MPRKNVARHLHYWLLLLFAASGSIAVAAPPIDAGSAGRNHSRMDRAMESRASLLGSARGSGMSDIGTSASLSGTARNGAASAGGSASLSNSANGGGTNAGGTTGTTASEAGRSTAASAKATNAAATGAPTGLMTDRSRRPDASFRLDASTARGLRGDNAARTTPGKPAAESRAHGQRPDSAKERPSLPAVSQAHARRSETQGKAKSDKAERALMTVARTSDSTRGQSTQAESFLNRRLAQIDRMRDDALASGDTEKLREADRLETLARSQYSQKTTGERTIGSSMKAFNSQPRSTEINPVGGSSANPEAPLAAEE